MRKLRLFTALAFAVSLLACSKEPSTDPVETPEPQGTPENPYVVMTVEDFKTVQSKIEAETTTYIQLGADLDFAEFGDFIPLNNAEPFDKQIHFDGKGYTIKNFTCKSGVAYPSFFGVLYGSCSNLNFTDANVNGGANVTGILASSVGLAEKPAVVTNVKVTGTVTSKVDRVGGLAGEVVGSTIEGCEADVTISLDALKYVGGLIGCAVSGDVVIKNSTVKGSVSAHSYMGGLIGGQLSDAKVTLEGCSCTADVTGVHHYTGGLAGHMDNADGKTLTIKNCYTTGNVRSNGSSCSTFLAFVAKGADIEGCYATGTLKAVNNLGGIVAWAAAGTGAVNIKNTYFTGEVSGQQSLGGLVGYSDGALNIENCYVHGRVAGITGLDDSGNAINTSLNAGGLLGQKAAGHVDVKNSHFSGYVFAYQRAGGVLSYVGTGTASMSQVYSTGLVEATGGTIGGLVAQSNNDLVLKNCWTSADVQGRYSNQFAGGILGTCATKIHIENCYAAGRVSVTRGAGGIIARCNGVTNSKVIKCIAWNPDIASPRTSAANYSSGAVIASIKGSITLTDCYRRADMIFTDPFLPYLCDHENVNNALPPLPEGDTDVNHYWYNGKAAAADATLASLAQSLGWDPAIWNFSSESSALGFAIKQLGDNKIEF